VAGDGGDKEPVMTRATQVVAGSAHTCALLSDGQVSCWGMGGPYGQLGYGNMNDVADTVYDLPYRIGTVSVLP
jgi:alpha-tubulin suppressor-like RCC1 family protein